MTNQPEPTESIEQTVAQTLDTLPLVLAVSASSLLRCTLRRGTYCNTLRRTYTHRPSMSERGLPGTPRTRCGRRSGSPILGTARICQKQSARCPRTGYSLMRRHSAACQPRKLGIRSVGGKCRPRHSSHQRCCHFSYTSRELIRPRARRKALPGLSWAPLDLRIRAGKWCSASRRPPRLRS